ncbi:hypothetical protein CDL15_Pgr024730 [Punica granatum]|uniref:Uncharacterized protein n=1 Tax=Punica granatum TaxID=22663 RepID=A0A218W4F4_PUNGR|nr:hypothetical protein CDL15_Pgr024730 [Punica granatum]
MDWAEGARTGRDQTGLRSTGLGRVDRRDWAAAERGLGYCWRAEPKRSGLGSWTTGPDGYLCWPVQEKLIRLAK